MKNETLRSQMINKYHRLSAVKDYILGITLDGVVYAVICDHKALPYVAKLDKASRGAGYSLRFAPTVAEKRSLLSNYRALPICSADFFKSICDGSKYNKGEVFESLIYKEDGQEWHKDTVPFTADGDITIGGVKYQIKFEKATFTNEKQLHKLS